MRSKTSLAFAARVLSAGAIVMLGMGGGGAQAALGLTANQTFNVSVTLTPACELRTTSISDIAMNYTSFTSTSSAGSTNFKVRCTSGLGYSLALDSATPTVGTSPTALNVNLELSPNATPSANPIVTPVASLSSLSGTSADQTYYVHASIAAGQGGTYSGTGTTSTSTATPRVTISY